MQVDTGDILAAVNAVLNISSYEECNDDEDEDKIAEQREYIEKTLEKHNIEWDEEIGGQYLVRGDDIPNAVEAFHLSLDDSWVENCGDGHVLIDLTGNDDVDATVYFTFTDDNLTSLASWLIYK